MSRIGLSLLVVCCAGGNFAAHSNAQSGPPVLVFTPNEYFGEPGFTWAPLSDGTIPPVPISLWNSGGGIINVSLVLLAGPDASKIALSGTLPTQLLGGNSPSTFFVRWARPASFFPTDPILFNARLLVNTDVRNVEFNIRTLPEVSTARLAAFAVSAILIGLRIGRFFRPIAA
jgi:hypothetical protein